VRPVAIFEALDLLSFPAILAAGVAKLVYAPDSKSGVRKDMSVRVRPPAPHPYEFHRKSAHPRLPCPNRVQGFRFQRSFRGCDAEGFDCSSSIFSILILKCLGPNWS